MASSPTYRLLCFTAGSLYKFVEHVPRDETESDHVGAKQMMYLFCMSACPGDPLLSKSIRLDGNVSGPAPLLR